MAMATSVKVKEKRQNRKKGGKKRERKERKTEDRVSPVKKRVFQV